MKQYLKIYEKSPVKAKDQPLSFSPKKCTEKPAKTKTDNQPANSSKPENASKTKTVAKKPLEKSKTKTISNTEEGRPPSYLPQLRSDIKFFKNCLRNKELWCKLSDDEKEYCRKRKEKMKRDKEHIRSEKTKEQNKTNLTKPKKTDCFLFPPNQKPSKIKEKNK